MHHKNRHPFNVSVDELSTYHSIYLSTKLLLLLPPTFLPPTLTTHYAHSNINSIGVRCFFRS